MQTCTLQNIVFILFISCSLFAQNIQVVVKGISNEQFDGLQKDREEAIIEAKRQACEKAGLNLNSTTRIDNFEIVQDLIETKANAVLQPGFEIVDIGYLQSGQYVVVLSGKVVSIEDKSAKAKLRFFIRHSDQTFLGTKKGALKAFYGELKKLSLKTFDGKLIEEYEKDLTKIYKKKNTFYTLVLEYEIPEGAYEYSHTNYLGENLFVKQQIFLKSSHNYVIKNMESKGGLNRSGFGPITKDEAYRYNKEFGKFPNEYELIFSKSDKSIVNNN